MIETAAEPTDGRLIGFLLQDPIQDGGQWDMFANLVRKYGVVPKSVMPETESSGDIDGHERASCAPSCASTPPSCAGGTPSGEPPARCAAARTRCSRRSTACSPSTSGGRRASSSGSGATRTTSSTATGRSRRTSSTSATSASTSTIRVSLINCPTADKPFGTLYTVQYLGNVDGGDTVRYLNVDDRRPSRRPPSSRSRTAAPVWFGCDVGKMMERDQGILDGELYDFELLYDTAVHRRQGRARRVRPQRHDARHGAHRRRPRRRGQAASSGASRTRGARSTATRATS